MTDASTLASAFVSAVAVVVSPLLIGFALSPAEPDLSQLQQQEREALDASRRVLALSEDCVRRVEQIESTLTEVEVQADTPEPRATFRMPVTPAPKR